jgi:hypothetical protein
MPYEIYKPGQISRASWNNAILWLDAFVILGRSMRQDVLKDLAAVRNLADELTVDAALVICDIFGRKYALFYDG